MANLQSAHPCVALRPFVRAYAQRNTNIKEGSVVEPVPARLEQILEFQLGDPYEVSFMDGPRVPTPDVVAVGLQTHLRVDLELRRKVESFAVFFQPTGLSQLFKVPARSFANQAFEATTVLGAQARLLWNRLGEARSFADRIAIVERFLLRLATTAGTFDSTGATAIQMLADRGTVSVADLARQSGLSRRQFERRFAAHMGLPPKLYSRVARFQTALDSKVANADRSWVNIAHDLGYFDQMHMIHDFQKLGGSSPERLLARLGNQRPPALASSDGLV
jgi:AraC-like DNA-binding protein